jgi:hypothetical protein
MNLEELRQKVLELPPIEPYALANPFWDERRLGLRHSLLAGDIDRFLSWPDIGFTMFLGNWPWVDEEYQTLLVERPSWCDSGTLADDRLGSPEWYKDTGSSANLIHQAFHLYKWEKATGRKVSELKSIVEIGGGYGCMCRLVHRLGFRGNYLIYDLPEVALLQEFYLSNTGVPVDHVAWVKKIDPQAQLIMSLWALSEMPSDLRMELLRTPRPTHYFFGYQFAFEGVDNRVFFQTFQDQRQGYEWKTERILHHPGESWYLFGNKSK